MKKKIQVIQHQKYDKTKEILYSGYATFHLEEDYECLQYKELDGTKVVMKLFDEQFQLQRFSETTTHLTMISNQKTKNEIVSEYGNIEIEIYTFAYSKNHDKIIVEYDILETDKLGYILEIGIEEGFNEFN